MFIVCNCWKFRCCRELCISMPGSWDNFAKTVSSLRWHQALETLLHPQFTPVLPTEVPYADAIPPGACCVSTPILTALTSQNFAPYLGGGESQNLNLLRVPPPQELVQCVQPLQAPHPPESDSATQQHTAVQGVWDDTWRHTWRQSVGLRVRSCYNSEGATSSNKTKQVHDYRALARF